MRLEWEMEPHDVEMIRGVVEAHENDYLVRDRWERCISGSRRHDDSRTARWMAMVACRLTTQQRSGPTAPINTFLRRRPNPLELESVRGSGDPVRHRRGASKHAGM